MSEEEYHNIFMRICAYHNCREGRHLVTDQFRTKCMVFEDGNEILFSSSGTEWVDYKDCVERYRNFANGEYILFLK